jgi:hypothetical protein
MVPASATAGAQTFLPAFDEHHMTLMSTLKDQG